MERRLRAWVKLRLNSRGVVSRRGFLGLAGAGALGAAGLHWLDQVGLHADELRRQGRACILLWMAGGPSQFESFDPKPGAETQGPTKAIASSVPGLQVAEHWTRTAGLMREL